MEIIFTCIWMKVGDVFSLVFILKILCIHKGRNLSYKGRCIIGPTANSIDLITFRSVTISFNKEPIIRRHINDKTTVPLWRKEPGLQAQHLLLCNKTISCWIHNWHSLRGLPWWLSGKELACWCRRWHFDPWPSRFPGEGNGYPLQYSCLGNSMDRRSFVGYIQ